MDASVSDLPGSVWIKVIEVLDTNPARKNWRALIGTLKSSNMINQRYKITVAIAYTFQKDKHNTQKELTVVHAVLPVPSASRALGSRDRKGECSRESDYRVGLTRHDQEIKITHSPGREMDINEGDTLVLEITATGKPHPRFQWFFCPDGQKEFNKLKGCTDKTLKIINRTSANAGSYSCQIHNCSDPQETKITEISHVSITPKQNSVSDRLNPPVTEKLAKMPLILTPTTIRHTGQDHEITIISHPTSKELELGDRALFMVEAQCGLPLRYQWIKDGK
ncbi:hypothetical protein MAR_022979, partial [Mya arenaria]